MKLRASLNLVLLIGALAIAYAVGFSNAKDQMENFCGFVISGSSAGDHIQIFAKHSEALKSIQAGDTASAEKILSFLARSDAARISECSAKPECARFMSSPSPDKTLLKAAMFR